MSSRQVLSEKGCGCQIRLLPLARPSAAIQHAQTGFQLQQVYHGIPCPLVPPAPAVSPSMPGLAELMKPHYKLRTLSSASLLFKKQDNIFL